MRKIKNQQQNIYTEPYGFLLEPPESPAKKESLVLILLNNFLLASLAVISTVLLVLSVFPLSIHTNALWAAIFVLLIFFTLSFSFSKIGNILIWGFIFFYCLGVYLYFSDIAQGFILCVNQVIDRFNNLFGTDFLLYTTKTTPTHLKEQQCTLFVLFVLAAFICLLCWIIIYKQSILLSLILTLPLPILLLGYTPYPSLFLLFLIFWFLLFVQNAGKQKQRTKLRKGKWIHSFNTASSTAKNSFLWLPILITLIVISSFCFLQFSPQPPKFLSVWRTQITDTIQKLWTGGSPVTSYGSATDRADLTGGGHISFTGETALRIKMSTPSPLYLKGFTGSVYTGFSWEILPETEFSQIQNKFQENSPLNLSAQIDQSILARHNSQFLQKISYQNLLLQNVNTNQKTFYFPYSLLTDPHRLSQASTVNDQHIHSFLPLGNSCYELETLSLGISGKSRDTTASLFLENGKWQVENYFQITQQNPLTSPAQIEAFYRNPVSEEIRAQLDDEAQALMDRETAYSNFVLDHYTALPDNLKKKLCHYLDNHFSEFIPASVEQNEVTLDIVVSAIQTMVQTSGTYTLSPGSVPAGRDFVDYFFFENHKGYCVHFASTAVAFLRAYGIPARYCEGYIVTQEEIQNMDSGGWINIPDSKSHAWAEYYIPGTGWVPLETTPGYSVTPNGTDTSSALSSSSSVPESSVSSGSSHSEEVSSSLDENDEISSPQTIPDTVSTPKNSLNFAELIPAITITLFILIFTMAMLIRRHIVINQFRKLKYEKDSNQALLKIYKQLSRFLTFTQQQVPDFANELAQKARYSAHKITKLELLKLYNYYLHVTSCYEQTLPTWKKLLFRYWYNFR